MVYDHSNFISSFFSFIHDHKIFDSWRASVVLSTNQERIYAAEDRDVNIIYDLITNSFQGIVQNWYSRISSNIQHLIELDVKRNSQISIEGV